MTTLPPPDFVAETESKSVLGITALAKAVLSVLLTSVLLLLLLPLFASQLLDSSPTSGSTKTDFRFSGFIAVIL